ncbi:MAG TPA: maleylpyruvate isomerase N-terminal domain-containing protein [Anaerolineales bacterium]|nr:maleylpyruvate isomerase N-terminal domain-containing protein [Anaerolineales bacterium]
MKKRTTLLAQMDESIAQLLDAYKNLENPDRIIYEGWTAKDVLGHLTFWHESFARNVSDLVNDKKPTPLKGTYSALNQQCFAEMRPLTVAAITKRLEDAHQRIQKNILNPDLVMIPYRKGSRDYSPEEHLDIVNQHIQEHLKEIKKINKTT